MNREVYSNSINYIINYLMFAILLYTPSGLCQLQNCFVTDADLHRRNVLHLSTTVLLRVHSIINCSPCCARRAMHDHIVCLYCMCTKQTNTNSPVMFTPTTIVGRGTPTPTSVVSSGTPTTTTPVMTPPWNTGKTTTTPSGPQGSSTDHANMQLQPDGKYPT